LKRKLTKTEKFLIITVILVAALYFYVNKFYDPAMTKLNNSRQSAVALQSEINQLGGYGGEMMLEKKVNNLHKEVDKLNKEVTDLSASKSSGRRKRQ
jgi:cell division protein FtsL